MANVLPPHERSAIRTSYWLRLAIVSALLGAVAVTISTVSLVPAYLAIETKSVELTQYLDLQKDARDIAKNDTAVRTARVVNAQVQAIQESVRHTNASIAVQTALRNWKPHAQDIIMSGFLYSRERVDDNTVPQLRISGQARNRSSLNEFVQTLRTEPIFTNVSFPVSDLAGEGEIDFSLTVTLAS